MNNLIAQVIHTFNGQAYSVAGFMLGFFDDPHQTQECAAEIVNLTEQEVEVVGNQLRIML